MPSPKRLVVRRNALASIPGCGPVHVEPRWLILSAGDSPGGLTINSRGRENRRFAKTCQRQKNGGVSKDLKKAPATAITLTPSIRYDTPRAAVGLPSR